jgi:hypothetical protein
MRAPFHFVCEISVNFRFILQDSRHSSQCGRHIAALSLYMPCRGVVTPNHNHSSTTMKPRIAILATLALFTAAPGALAQTKAPEAPKEVPKEAGAPVKEADFAKGVLGTWRQEIKQGPMVGHALTTYTEDGKASAVLNMDMQGQKMQVTTKAKWSIEKNKMSVEILECSMPDMMPVGTKITQTIISLTDKEFTYKDETAGEKRVKTDEKKPAAEDKPAKK